MIVETIGGVCVIVGASAEGVRSLGVLVDRVILSRFLGNAEVEARFLLSEVGGWISIIDVSAKCCDCGRAVGSSSICLSMAIGYCNEKSSRLVCLVPEWLWVIRLLFGVILRTVTLGVWTVVAAKGRGSGRG